MQCQSYFPVYYTHNDHNMDANGSRRPIYTGHVAPATGHFGQRFLASTATQGYLGYNKEFLRRIILEQEVTFRDQVQELHRLYRRQKELLDEIKRNDFYRKRVHSKAQWLSNPLTFSHPSTSGASSVDALWPSSKGESIAAASHTSQGVTSSNTVDLSLFQSKRAQKKLLDLQLPADEYINSEERKPFKDFEVSGVSILSSHSSNRAYPVAPVGNAKLLLPSSSPTTFSSQVFDFSKFSGSKHTSDGTLDDYVNKKLKMCKEKETDKTDAWQGWQLGVEAGKSRASLNSFGWHSYSQSLQVSAEIDQAHQTTTHSTKKDVWHENGRTDKDAKILGCMQEKLNLNIPGKVDLTLGESLIAQPAPCLLPELSTINNARMQCKSQAPCVDEFDYSSRCRVIHEKGRSLQSSCSESHAKASSSSGFLFQSSKCDLASAEDQSAKHMNCLDSIDLNSTGVVHHDVFSANNMVSREKEGDLTSPKSVFSQVFPSPSKSQPNNRLLGSCQETASLGSINHLDQMQTGKSKIARLFDINVPCDPTTDMDDPVGDDCKQLNPINLDPHVKDDQSPPSLQVSTGEDGDSLEELMKIAVNVLISISSSELQPHLADSEQCLGSNDDHLIWFAGLVCSVEQGDGFAVTNSKYEEKCEEISSSTAIDYFEAMTLKLTETSQEDYGSNITTLHNEKETCDMPLYIESGRGRTTRRAKKKDFQREVLPSLASLSRYEVSEDIQIIEKLMKQQEVGCNWVMKTRKVGRNGRLRGRKRSRVSMAASEESRTCLLALPHVGHMAISALDLRDKGRVKWEIMPRRARGHRSRALSPHITLSQEGWMRKWGGSSFVQKGKKKHKQVQMLLPRVR